VHDAALLQALLDHRGLRPHEREAFRSMAARRADGRALSYGQRAWAQDVAHRLGVQGGGGHVGHVPEVMSWVAPPPKMTAARREKIEAGARATSREIAAYRRMMARG
jgi:hypothetical protein